MRVTLLIGIDEAGRGPLAGPVAVGAVCISPHARLPLRGLKDSKRLSEKARDEWFAKMKVWQKEGKLSFAVSLVSHSVIDAKGITAAVRQGIRANLRKLKAEPRHVHIYLDGLLKAPERFLYQQTIVKGDEKVKVISLASIAAKVTRDAYMGKLAKKYPLYHFDIHKGYGTARHCEMIKKHGASPVHRKSFLKNFDKADYRP